MKKYKLVKIYNGSPKINTEIVETMTIGPSPKFRTFTISGPNKGDFRVDNPEISPEYWQEIVDKDYEILSLMYNNILYDKVDKTDSNWKYLSKRGSHCLLSQAGLDICGMINIYSVKKLSDGEEFTIGDKAIPKKCKPNTFTITGFKLDCNNNHMLALGGNGGININKLKPVKKPLFTTEDNVDIFEGDGYWKVIKETCQILPILKATRHEALRSKVFSTKAKAKEYSLINKPCLSMQDLKRTGCLNDDQWYAILDFVKHKSKL